MLTLLFPEVEMVLNRKVVEELLWGVMWKLGKECGCNRCRFWQNLGS